MTAALGLGGDGGVVKTSPRKASYCEKKFVLKGPNPFDQLLSNSFFQYAIILANKLGYSQRYYILPFHHQLLLKNELNKSV